MLTRSIESPVRKITPHHSKNLHITQRQHGFPSLLPNLPQESLTHITSYLSPPSLLALARTCRRLCEHIDDDNTWLRALLTQFLGISPEHVLNNQHFLLLRRIEHTWRKEFMVRYAIGRRWERSRTPTITHAPQDSSIDGACLILEDGLLTLSIQYGTVARSTLLNGNVLKGYINASGTGMGIGNPNVEFTPNVSACTLTSDGGTARVFWGKRNGEVALTVANHVMDSRAAFKFIQCGVNEQHEGVVQQLVPDPASTTFLSTGADGRIKLWDTETLRLLWSIDRQQLSPVTDPFISIAGGLSDGFVAGALKSGDVLLYDLHDLQTCAGGPRVRLDHQIQIPSLIQHDRLPSTTRRDALQEQHIAKMWLYRTGESMVLLFVQYTSHPQFYRVYANIHSHDVTITPFGDGSFGNVSVVEPIISTNSCYNDMIIVGDLLGFVSIYDANVPPPSAAGPVHRFEAHTDGAVTAISWSPTVLATGSARGTTVVWDSLTLEPLRYFTSPSPRRTSGHDWIAVSQILMNKDMVVIIIGNRVMAWKVGPIDSRGHQHKKPKHANAKTPTITRGHQQYEMHEDVNESYRELEYETAYAQRGYDREREHRSTLDTLGLSELEAVEYVLMLSREEEEAHQQRTVIDEGVFEVDLDDLPSTPMSLRSRSAPSMPLSSHRLTSNYYSNTRQHPRVAPPMSNEKIQVSPPFVPEPMEAGMSISPRSLTIESTQPQPSPVTIPSVSSSSLEDFPTLSSSLSSTSSSRRGTPASAKQPRSAWNTPLKSLAPLPGPSSPRSRAAAPVTVGSHSSNVSLLSTDIAQHREAVQAAVPDVEMDNDLRLAIELSLAEARSREGRV